MTVILLYKVIYLALFAVSFSVVLGSQAAFAEVVTFDFEMEVTEVNDVDNFLGGTVVPGDVMTGSYTFNTNTPDLDPAVARGQYQIIALSIQVGPISYETNPPLDPDSDVIVVVNDLGNDFYFVSSITLEQLSGPTLPTGEVSAGLTLGDFTETALSDDSLPPSPPPLTSFSGKEGGFQAESLDEEDFVEVISIVTSITKRQTTQVVGGELLPIDSTALMLAGLQTSAIWMLPVLAGAAGVGIAAFKLRRK